MKHGLDDRPRRLDHVLAPEQCGVTLHRVAEQPLERALPAAAPFAPRTVSPGLVPWHADFAAACAAAQRSGKPVLLFQLLGRLDEEFC